MVILWTSLHQPLLDCLTKHSEDQRGWSNVCYLTIDPQLSKESRKTKSNHYFWNTSSVIAFIAIGWNTSTNRHLCPAQFPAAKLFLLEALCREQSHPKHTPSHGHSPGNVHSKPIHPREPPGAKRSCRLSLHLEVEHYSIDENMTGRQNLPIFLNSQRAGGKALINLMGYTLWILCSVLPRRLHPNQDHNSKLSQCPNIPLL